MAQRVSSKNLPSWYAWVVLAAVWLAAFTAPANMVKVTALAAPIMEWFAIDEASVSWVMSMFYIMGCVFAFPAAGIMKKLGMRKTVVIALVTEHPARCATASLRFGKRHVGVHLVRTHDGKRRMRATLSRKSNRLRSVRAWLPPI